MKTTQGIKRKKIVLVSPSLTSGGAERVISVLANEFGKYKNLEVHLVLLVKGVMFYSIDKDVIIHQPDFDYLNFSRLRFTFKTFGYLRKLLKQIRPESLLSFGGKYNSFILLASIGFNIKTYISDRSRPGISYGKVTDFTNKHIYKISTGIVAQTSSAANVVYITLGHKNVKVIGNPFFKNFNEHLPTEKIILNVGRFIKSKQQKLLIQMFDSIEPKNRQDWKIWFLGEGEYLESCIDLTQKLNLNDKIKFFGNRKDVENYYQKASIFAFTSISEGFPNALGEAMSAGCACISFDCLAGPTDLIDSEVNGILIKENNLENYKHQLETLMLDEDKRNQIQRNAIKKISMFDNEKISKEYLKFMVSF